MTIRVSRGVGAGLRLKTGDYGVMGATTECTQAAQAAMQAMQLELAYSSAADGSAVVSARGELDIATAGQAFAYLRDVVDSHRGPLTVDLAELTFCDAAGLGALAKLAGHARRTGRELKLTSARPSVLKIMRITGMDLVFPEVARPSLSMIAWPRQATAAD